VDNIFLIFYLCLGLFLIVDFFKTKPKVLIFAANLILLTVYILYEIFVMNKNIFGLNNWGKYIGIGLGLLYFLYAYGIRKTRYSAIIMILIGVTFIMKSILQG